MNITDRMASLLTHRGVKPRSIKPELAKACDISYEAVRQWFAGETNSIKNEHLIAIARKYKTTVDWLLTGAGEMDKTVDLEALQDQLNGALSMHGSDFEVFEENYGCTRIEAIEWRNHGFSGNERAIACIERMPSLKALNARQHSNIVETQQPYRTERKYPLISDIAAGTWMESCDNFHPGTADEWLSSDKNAGPHGYWLLVKGRSMEPHFMNGDRILVQPEGFDLINGKYYVAKLLDSGDTTFKQYIKDAGIAYLQPLNNTFPLIQVTDNVSIIGRVIDKRLDPSFF